MVDMTNILGRDWKPEAKRVDPPDVQLMDAIRQSGLEPPATIHFDGQLHRFSSGTKGSGNAGDKAGWYVAFSDNIPAARFGCWRLGVESTWRAEMGRTLSAAEEMAHVRRMEEAKQRRDEELAKKREVAADAVAQIWAGATHATADHPYLQRKGINPHGARITGDGRLVLPLYDKDGKLTSLQYINHDGEKRYHTGGATGGAMWVIGSGDGVVYVAEGFATAASIHEATGQPVLISYSAHNLMSVTEFAVSQYGAGKIVVVGDNDESGTGQKVCGQISQKLGVQVILPPVVGDANDYAQAGNDLRALLMGDNDDDWLVPADEFSIEPAPIRWIVKGWVQDEALVMVHGMSGGGKSFVTLDWCMRVASGGGEWCGQNVRGGNVVYLAGEGHHGIKGRIAAWKQHNHVKSLKMWLSKDGCDLNTPTGYQRVVNNLRKLPVKPNVIVVDTVHRFMLGDENSAKDVKTILDACNALMREFGCTVILVHHTGVSEEAQHRARGSSAWRGALDIEISIVPSKKEGDPIQIIQRKSKDAELATTVYVDLLQVGIDGWLDEDGNTVTSAVVVQSEAPPEAAKKPSKLDGFRKMFENGWWSSGAEEFDGKPYVSRSGLREKLLRDGNAERTVRNMLNPSYADKLIGYLTQAGVIEAVNHGWMMIDPDQAAAMILSKSS